MKSRLTTHDCSVDEPVKTLHKISPATLLFLRIFCAIFRALRESAFGHSLASTSLHVVSRRTSMVQSFQTVFLLVAEIEAVEACNWLRAAGFPQYAQMYDGE